MKPVILAEKPSQAKDYAEALKPTQRKDGYIEVEPNSFFSNGAIITWAIGHLLELAEPVEYKPEWGNWNIEQLPMIPETFKYEIDKSKKKQFSIVSKLLKDASEIIIATDSGREGENIARLIIKEAKVEHKPIKRLWISSLSVEAVQKGFANLKDGSHYYPLFLEAQTRQMSDWIVGLNATRLYTVLLQKKGIKDVFSVGRVQTPSLFMIYKREQEILNFKPKPYYELEGEAKHSNGSFTVKAKVKEESKQNALDILSKHNILLDSPINSVISKVEHSHEKQSSPKLYNLSSIQAKANKLWKYSPKNVLKHVQSLYEKKLVSYPRTDTPYITEDEFSYLVAKMKKYQEIIDKPFDPRTVEPESRYVNSKEVKEHYAIIPTEKIPTQSEIENLTQEEKNIYYEIIKNTLSMFHGKYEYNKTVLEIDINGLVFMTTGKTEISKGWKDLFTTENEDEKDNADSSLPIVNENDSVSINVNIKEGKTTKPKRYTEGQLIPLMINCGKELEDEEKDVLKETEGIGTEATRADIIETLKNKKYIEIKKNLVHITNKGIILCEAVKGNLLSSPSMTAKWEKFLKMIGRGERDQKTFLSNIEKFVNKMIADTPSQISTSEISRYVEKMDNDSRLGVCPLCKKGHILEKKTFYGCSDYKSGCKQTFPKKLLEKTVSQTQMKKLLSKGKTDVIKGFKGKTPFDSFLTIELDEEKNVYKYKFNKAKK
ncbi:DNA topoisomerase III [Bacillus paralicheniformis]|jgi:DNA topoisomerase-3|uniref:type IA DNA topoisomerase n=1 Tax=Bacillus TaxID=1386 RepID=UPI0013EE42CC|nr:MULTISPECIES: type IA DNA topoisomerase [Bacillus]QII26967.1 DNA topoisomerase III [Bacillus altitudinis]QII51435.1 DNA topoisomerase III [Bacillus paralicheniformis]